MISFDAADPTELQRVREETRAASVRSVNEAWRQSAEPDATDDPGPEPDLSPYEARKRELGRAWVTPPQPWGQASQPRYWSEQYPILDPTTTILAPSSRNPSKGSGTTLSAEEIRKLRYAEQIEFATRLRQRWVWNLSHL